MHILSPEIDNCPSWISWRERITIADISSVDKSSTGSSCRSYIYLWSLIQTLYILTELQAQCHFSNIEKDHNSLKNFWVYFTGDNLLHFWPFSLCLINLWTKHYVRNKYYRILLIYNHLSLLLICNPRKKAVGWNWSWDGGDTWTDIHYKV